MPRVHYENAGKTLTCEPRRPHAKALLTLRARRRPQLIQIIFRVKVQLISDQCSNFDESTLRTLNAYGTTRRFLKAAEIQSHLEDLIASRKQQLALNVKLDWGDTNSFKRTIHGGAQLPPVSWIGIQCRLEKVAFRSNSNRIRCSHSLSAAKEQSHFLLGNSSLIQTGIEIITSLLNSNKS